MIETAKAREAFEDYVMLGPDRSLVKLSARYRQRSGKGLAVPTRRTPTLELWSVKYDWQAKVLARVEADCAEIRMQLRERSIAFRLQVATCIEEDITRYLDGLAAAEDGAGMVDDAGSFERAVKLFFLLAEMPLADRTEHTGLAGGPIEVEHDSSALDEFKKRLAALSARQLAALAEADEPVEVDADGS